MRPSRQQVGQRGNSRGTRSVRHKTRVRRVALPSEAADMYKRGLQDGILLAVGHASVRVPRVDSQVEQEFRSLAETWYLDTLVLSSYFEKILHPSYQRILTLGDGAITLILRELQYMPNDWFWALRILAHGADPVRAEQAGDLEAMADAWLEWGRSEGYI